MLTAAVLAALACLLWPMRPRPSDPSPGSGTARSRHPTTARAPAVAGRARAAFERLRPGRRQAGADWVADFAEVVAVGLAAGLDLPSAAMASARSPGVHRRAPWLLERLSASVQDGTGVTGFLEGHTRGSQDERRDLRFLVAAWRLAENTGAGASAVTASAAASVREHRAAAERTVVVAAGPRASMTLLSALPLAGPVAAALVGLPPGRLYDTTASRALAVGGLALCSAGWWWARSMLRRAGRPGRTDEGPS